MKPLGDYVYHLETPPELMSIESSSSEALAIEVSIDGGLFNWKISSSFGSVDAGRSNEFLFWSSIAIGSLLFVLTND